MGGGGERVRLVVVGGVGGGASGGAGGAMVGEGGAGEGSVDGL